MQYWLMKNEPSDYAWQDLTQEGTADWDGVRNYQARNNMQKMKEGDLALFYHSVNEKRIMGVMRITREAHPDPTTDDERWVAVEVAAVQALNEPVTLKAIKAEPSLSEIPLIKQSRLSVMPLSEEAFHTILQLGNTQLNGAS
jgi:predicted RNA-binding protein with PUA-like domain